MRIFSHQHRQVFLQMYVKYTADILIFSSVIIGFVFLCVNFTFPPFMERIPYCEVSFLSSFTTTHERSAQFST